jgi:hypothetical protein
MVFAYTSGEGVGLDHYAGEIKKLRRGSWVATDRAGIDYAGASAEEVALKLPRSVEAVAIYDARTAPLLEAMETAAGRILDARREGAR